MYIMTCTELITQRFHDVGSTGTNLRAPDSDELKLSAWGLPDAVYKRYEEKAISQMFPWQAECLCLPGVLGNSMCL